MSAIGPELCKALPALHALSGYDFTGALSGIGKKTALRKLQKGEDHMRNISQLGDAIPPTEATVRACEKYVFSVHYI